MSDPVTEDLEDLYEHAPCGYLSLQPDGRICKANATFSAWLDIAPDDFLDRPFQSLLDTASRILFETHVVPMLRLQGHFHEMALDFRLGGSGRFPALVNAAERRSADGRHLFTRLTVFNAAKRRQYERDLVQARAAAEAAEARLRGANASIRKSLLDEQSTASLREQFIAVLGHDLRNPLAAIDAGTRLLSKTPLDARAVEVIGLMRGSVGRMGELIDNVMDLARGRLGGGLPLARTADGPLEPILRQVVAELQSAAPQRHIETDLAIHAPVDCDPRRIAQLASNLLGNALKHGAPDGMIRLSAAARDGAFELSVANTGAPIPAEMMAVVFEPFSRGASQPGQEGLGLGLYICREIATAHGGTLTVASDTERTVFTLRI